tara:strand:- start:5155 stop:6789 length:1635 start_codon:yes stop_codon:yes gene_type:complete
MKKNVFSLLFGLFFSVTFANQAFAQEVNDIGIAMTDSMSSLPGFVAAFAYLGGLIMAVSAIFKTIDHITNPNQTPLSTPVIRFLLGGALFALPIIAEAASTTISGGTVTVFSPSADAVTILNGMIGGLSALISFGTNANAIMESMMGSVEFMPGLIAAVSYLLGLVIAVSALYKTRDHVEDPNRVPLKDSVIRYITAGALFALPTVFEAMYETIVGSGMGIVGTFFGLLSGLGFFYSSETNAVECLTVSLPLGTTLGDALCWAMISSSVFPVFLTAVSYLLGLVLGLWGILKVRDHVIDPSRVPLSEGVSRLIAGGAFFAFPYVSTILKASFTNAGILGLTTVTTNTSFNSSVTALTCGGSNSLDEAMGCFMNDILGPSHVVLNFFAFVAGMIFVMIGISRLIKSAQEGPRGPGGMGTFGTFVIGGMLMSATTLLRAFSSSLFTSPVTFTFASMQYTTGMSAVETQAAHNVISAVLQFMIVLGMLSFVRGMFIMRDVAEGSQQASTMSGVTHLIGGALAVNLGPLLNAVQQTLGITAFGVTFLP